MTERYTTIRWLCELHAYFRFASETLHLAVHLLDRYVEHQEKPDYILWGATAFWLAAKYEEVKLPHIKTLLRLARGAFTLAQLKHCELAQLKQLDYRLTLTTDVHTIEHYRRIGLLRDDTHRRLVYFILEASLFHPQRYHYTTLERTCAALYLARSIHRLQTHPWSVACAIVTGLRIRALRPAISFLHGAVKQCSSVVRQKYERVATLPVPRLPKYM